MIFSNLYQTTVAKTLSVILDKFLLVAQYRKFFDYHGFKGRIIPSAVAEYVPSHLPVNCIKLVKRVVQGKPVQLVLWLDINTRCSSPVLFDELFQQLHGGL